MKLFRLALVVAIAIMSISPTTVLGSPPPLPSSFYGTVKLDGVGAPTSALISAWINGVKYSETAVRIAGTESVYLLDVPADDPATSAPEGGSEGQTIIFKVDGHQAAETGVWKTGSHSQLNLTAHTPIPPRAAFSVGSGLNAAQLEDGASIAGYSSVYQLNATYRPENAIDTNDNSAWYTASGKPNNQSLTIKLAGSQPQVVSQIVLRGGNTQTDVKNFQVQVSATGTAESDFTTVLSGTNPKDAQAHTFNFAPVAARYVRLIIVDNHGNSTYTVLNDLDVRTRDHEGGIVSLREGPRASVVAFSSQDSNNYKAEHIIDESINTVWFSAFGQVTNQWVKIKLGGGKTYTINKVRLHGSGHADEIKDFQIRVSTTTADDSAFTTVFSGTRANTSGNQEFSFPPVAAKYVQLFAKNNYGRSEYIRVDTFQVLTTDGAIASRLEGVGAFVLASSSQATSWTGPEQAIDFSSGGAWETTGPVTNQWFKLGLVHGAPHLVDRVKLQGNNGSYSVKDFEVRVSNTTLADADFKTVLTGTLPQDNQAHWYTFPPVAAKYVQLYLLSNHGHTTAMHVTNFQVYSPQRGGAPVAFDDQSSDPDSAITGWQWSFGDGAVSSEQHPSHTYAAPGTYQVSLTVTSDDGLTATKTMPYTVLRSPTIDNFTWAPAQPKEDNSNVTFTGSAGSEDGIIIDWRWRFPFETNEDTGQTTTTSFTDSGPYPVTLTVLDSQFLSRKLTKQVTVENLAPSVDAGPDKQLVWGQAWNTNIWNEAVTQSMTVSDPSSADNTNLTCDWNFGDGQTRRVQACSSTTARVVHTYSTPGTYTATLTVTDKDNGVSSDTLISSVDRRKLSIYIPRDQIVVGSGTIAATAKVVDEFDAQASQAGKTILWSIGTETKTAVVGADNKVSVQLNRPALANPVITAQFAGDTLYHPARSARALGEQAGVRDNQGTDFWLMFDSNYSNTDLELSLFVTSAVNTIGTVQIPGLGFTKSFSVTADQVTTVVIPPSAVAGTTVQKKGIHVESLDEVTVYGLNRIKFTTDAYLGLPTDALGTEYLVLAYGYTSGGSQFGVVATADNTTITVTLPSNLNTPPYTVKLNQGDVYELQRDPDVSGTRITSNNPIAVYGSHLCAYVPSNARYCDHLVEQLPPVEAWGREFVTVPLATRTKGDTFRFLAARDETKISVNNTVVATLNRGQVHERVITGSSHISATEPILVAQYSNGTTFDGVVSDPFMMLIPPYEQFQRSYTVTTPASGFRANYINIVAPQAAISGVKMDGTAIPSSQFTQISGSTFYGAQIQVSLGSRNLTSPLPFGIFMYGFDTDDSYGYPGGASQAPVASVAHLTVAPPAATHVVGTQHCVTATVTDTQGQALESVRVDFTVAGNHPGTAFVTTNAAGKAQYCYTGTKIGTDTITAVVGALSATASASWQPANTPPVAHSQAVSASEDTPQTITLTATDGQNDPLSYTVLTQPANGTISGTVPTLIYTPKANYHGSDSFTFKVSDGTGDSNTATVTITIAPVNDSPNALDDTATTDEDLRAAIDVLANDSDIDGNPLTVVAVTQPAHGTAEIITSGNNPDEIGWVRYTPAANYHGADSFSYTTSDGHGGSAIASVALTIRPVNDQPVAASGSVTTAEDTAIGLTLTGSDLEHDSLTYSVVSQPTNGTLSGSAPNLTYTPKANYNGSDSFTFRVSDGSLNSNSATVAITVTPVNDPPTASNGDAATDEDTAVTIDLGTLVSDMETQDDANLTYVIDSLPGNGTLSGSGAARSYTPQPDFNGTDRFTYHVVDRGDADNCGTASAGCAAPISSATKTVTITVRPVNDAPQATNDGPKAARQYSDPIVPVTVTATDRDTPLASLKATTSWKLAGAPGFTTTPALPGGLTLTAGSTPATWRLSGTALLAADSYTIRVTIGDGAATTWTDITLIVDKEDAGLEYSGNTLKTTASTQNTSTASVTLVGIIRETIDGSLGSKLGETQLKFTVYKTNDTAMTTPVTTCTRPVAVTGVGVGNATCTVDLVADNYIVNVELLSNGYYVAPVESQAVTVVQPGTGMTNGGGWLNEPQLGTRSNFGFTVKYLRSGTIQGNSLYIYRKTVAANTIALPAVPGTYLPAGEYNWIIKSNAMTGLTQTCTTTAPTVCTATFTGKNTITAVNRSTGIAYNLGGNYQFQVDLTDNGEPGSSTSPTPDTYALRVWDSATGTYYQLGTASGQIALDGGNIQVSP
jgi:PKD repeat protein